MRFFVYILFSLFTLSGQADVFSKRKLLEKIQHPPTWMMEQIQSDLSPFSSRDLTEEKMKQTMHAIAKVPSAGLAQISCISIKNNTISWSSLTQEKDDNRLTQLLNFLQEIMQIAPLPNATFLISGWDCFDRPLYVYEAKCPVFAIGKRRYNKQTILIPETRTYLYFDNDYYNIARKRGSEFPWGTKKEIAYWRGNTTGGDYEYYGWDFKPRSEVVLFSKFHPHLVNAKFVGNYCLPQNIESTFNQYGLFDSYSSQEDQLGYKYLIAIDGNSWPSSLQWQLFSYATILKQESDFLEYYYNALKPYVHYVPYRTDCSDLEEKINWLKSHDAQAQEIAKNARAFADENISLETMAAYYYHLITAYAKVQSSAR